MLPIPTRSALAAIAGAVLLLGLGALTASWPAALFGGTLCVGLALCLAATMPLGRRVRRHRLEFAWWLAHAEPGTGGGAVVPDKPFDVRCFLRHRGAMRLELRDLTPLVPGGARRVDEDADVLSLAPNARTEFTFRLVAPAVGRVVLHGLAVTLPGPLGLFEVPLYFPNPLVIKVLPKAALRARAAPRAVAGLPVEQIGASLSSPAGSGTELRELRELRPGDPFKAIAWRASARAGRLMVREVEQEVQETRYVVLDVSGTMRGGAPGRRKLDFAVEATAAEARRALDAGDRFGLVTVDGRMLAHVTPNDGRPQLLRVFEALLGAIEAVDEDLTEIDDAEVAAVVGGYVRQQDGVDFSRGDGKGWNVPLLVRHVGEALEEVEDRDPPVRASSPAGVVLRRFCRVRGIPLPYRPDPRDGAKGPGLAAALREIGGRSRSPMSIAVVTDFDAIGSLDDVVASAKLLRMHRHQLAFVVPDATTFADPPEGALERTVFGVYARTERRHFHDARAALVPLGVPVIRATGEDSPGLVLARAHRAGRRRAA
ncbi:MAG: DUF58 domain-containing protein [Sandaracinaceae bacterium]|nr:DUF58 domain-containing protein [Sandaracinaceae bacterium]